MGGAGDGKHKKNTATQIDGHVTHNVTSSCHTYSRRQIYENQTYHRMQQNVTFKHAQMVKQISRPKTQQDTIVAFRPHTRTQ